MLLRGNVGVDTVTDRLRDTELTELAERIELTVSPAFDEVFPAHRKARLSLTLSDGETIESDIMEAAGDPESPMSDSEIVEKFLDLAAPQVGERQAVKIAEAVGEIEGMSDARPLLDAILTRDEPD